MYNESVKMNFFLCQEVLVDLQQKNQASGTLGAF